MIEAFQVVRDGEVLLKGMQRIGWDPQAKHVRSWVFDTAGGFGEGLWTPVGDAWVCKLTSTTPEGDSASATRTLAQATNDRIILQVTDRRPRFVALLECGGPLSLSRRQLLD